MPSPILSICIPTYNRAVFLREALDSVLSQVTTGNRDMLEIVVSDNASADGTAEMMKGIMSSAQLEIKYNRNAENVGDDRNFLKLIELATGKYCWILGDDDRLAPGAIGRILAESEINPAVDQFLTDRENWDIKFSRRYKMPPVLKLSREAVFDFKRTSVGAYLDQVNKLPGIFSYLSNVIFKREKWLSVENKDQYIGSHYIHLYMFMSMAWGGEKGVLKYLPEKLVLARWGNDRSFSSEALFDRIKYDADAFGRISHAILRERRLTRKIDYLLLKNDLFSWTVRTRISAPRDFFLKALPYLFKEYWDVSLFWLKILPLILVPGALLRSLRQGYRQYVKGEDVREEGGGN